ncbi:MAG: hypothetical protein UR61_C0001G0012 [candidate division WS6 bacterium GW2011_GWE1_34_7]|uniref:Uncharacterized protein n=1 Tax=candidate division WS6 bacterium GW2011_GWE1_34_7 TaxID=1619093 RepID=A0A0G0BAB1_9BACT|nr:MAG: hypothetical protein UR61_C0001G0012 [candidate division WS6 bacterium GW2011_GWE1_34_7]
MKIKISVKNFASVLIIITGSIIISVFGVKDVFANCCGAPPNGFWFNGCCYAGGSACCTTSAHWCDGDEPCDSPSCVECGDGVVNGDEECERDADCIGQEYCTNDCECKPDADDDDGDDDDPIPVCDRCTLPLCPNPPLSNTVSSYAILNFVSCTDSGECTPPTDHFGDCYEVPTTPPDVYFEILPEDDPTTYGFESETHTGAGIEDNEVNEPIRMRARFIDPDNISSPSDIETMYVWFSKSTSTPNTPKYIDLNNNSGQAAKTATYAAFGFLMHKEGGTWVPYVPSILGSSAGDKWVRAAYTDNTFTIKGPSGLPLVNIHINRIRANGWPAVAQEIDFNVYFQTNNPVQDGLYNIFGMANKTFGFTPYDNYDAYPEVKEVIGDYYAPEEIRDYNKWYLTSSDWNVDLHNPSINSFVVSVVDKTNLRFTWTLTDNLALYGIVGNLYRSEEFEDIQPFDVTISSDGTKDINTPFTPLVQESGDIVGHLTDDKYLFRIIGNDGTGYATLDVNDNRKGIIYMHITGFDKGGNVVSDYIEFDLRDWMATQGGLLFSRNGIDITSRTLEDVNLWNTKALINKFNPITADVSSELVADSTLVAPTAPDKSNVIDSYMVRPYNVTDLQSYYSILKNSFEKKKSSLQLRTIPSATTTLTGNLVNDASLNIRYLDKTGDLTVGTPSLNFNCNGKGVFFVSGNLTINGRILNANANKDACIFVVGGNVVVLGGANVSGNTAIQYDPLNAYILTDGTFIIQNEAVDKTINDGLYVGGGIHTLGGLTLNRYLNLGDRLQYPAFLVDHHSKYGVFAGQIFGTQVNIQKVEVGIKP